MLQKSIKAFRNTALVIRILERLLGSKFNIDGIENLPDNPVLFVANHFTRSETFIIPYIIYKYTKRQVRCLADESLFRGILGRFLKTVGAVSTRDPHRNRYIISDLMTGNNDWMIYPEGSMVKNKQISFDGKFIINTPGHVGRTRTGAAVLALKSELYRINLIRSRNSGRADIVEAYHREYGVEYSEELEKMTTQIVPVNITYYPIRPGNNIIKKFADKLFKSLPRRIAEELEIEGNLILSSNINVGFGKPININDYVKTIHALIYPTPIIKHETKVDLMIKYLKYGLTRKFMEAIYSDTKINIDHLFSAILYHYHEERIEIDYLKMVLFVSAIMIKKTGKYRTSYSIAEENLYKILIDEPHKEYDSIENLALKLGIITISDDRKHYIINYSKLNDQHDFHAIRLENTMQVIVNEFMMLEVANAVLKRNLLIDKITLKSKAFEKLLAKDQEIYNHDYQKYFDPQLSKAVEIGRPFFLNGVSEEVGVLICHGYQSSPKEVETLSRYINQLGFKVYAVRLRGHGTAPINMRDISWEDWYDSVQRGYAALRIICSRVIVVGFSTGGLLSLLTASRKNVNSIAAVICINAALKLQDIRSKVVPSINLWNVLLERFKIKKGKFEYIQNKSENPSVNYPQNYLNGVAQLGIVMKKCAANLKNITAPALIIHSSHDPIVNPESGKILVDTIKSPVKKLIELDMNKHIIIIDEAGKKVFDEIKLFLVENNLCQN